MNMLYSLAISPVTGDVFRPWMAAAILIVSVIVLVSLFLFNRKDRNDKNFDDQDEES